MRKPNAGTVDWTLAYPLHPVTGLREPNPKQALAHMCPADILLFGGARGGGKTEFVGVDAGLHHINYPNMLSFIFRKTRDEMKLNVIPVLKRIFPSEIARWSRQDHAFLFFNGGALVCDFLENEESIGRYLGTQAGLVYIDQGEQLTEYTVAQCLSLLRALEKWPKQMKITANPGLGVGVSFLRRWFIKPVAAELGNRRPPKPMEVWRPLPKKDDPTPIDQVPTRCFIPARFQDNTALQASDPAYLGKIYAGFTPEVARAQAEGDWESSDSMIVGSKWADKRTVGVKDTRLLAAGLKVGDLINWHVIENDEWRPPVGAHIYGSIDYGFGLPFSFHLHAILPGGHSRTFYEIYQTKLHATLQATKIADALSTLTYSDGRTKILTGLQWMVFDPSMDASRAEMNLSTTIIEDYQDVFKKRFGKLLPMMAGAAGRGSRLGRPGRWLDALATAPDGWPWWAVTTACPNLIRTVPEVPRDPKDPDVEDDDSENHCYEDVGRFFTARPHAPRTDNIDEELALLDPISRAHQEAMSQQHDPQRIQRIVVPGMGQR